MASSIGGIVLILVICIIFYFIWHMIYFYSENIYIKSTLDNKMYMIRKGNNKSTEFLQKSADTLAQINFNIIKLINHLMTKYKDDKLKNYFIIKLKDNYNPYIISEAAIDPRYTTYTVDKQDIHICLRTRDKNENLYDINILMYVLLHELSHLCNYNQYNDAIIGHGTEFLNIFSLLTQESIDIGVYRYENYKINPQEYCGLIINSNIL